MLWGLSPALDLIQQIRDVIPVDGKTEFNVLIAGAADARHILKTISKVYTHNLDVTVNFYVLDVLPEFIARQMLLLTVALEPPEKLGLNEKARLWMELYGNTLLRPSSAEYVVQKSYQLIHMVTNKSFLARRMPCINLESMKYKERDQLENIFRYWIKNDFKIIKHWDTRLRKSLATRYDAKMGVFDWDYHMKLHNIEHAGIVNATEYKQWRNNGVAFTWLETEVCITNPTFALGIFPQGDVILSHGFCGDMEFGPYFTFGIDCEDKDMMKTVNGSYRKRSTDVIERNLIRMFYEIENQTQYEFVESDELNMGTIITAISNLDTESEGMKVDVNLDKAEEGYSPIGTRHSVNFISMNSLQTYPFKEKFKSFFDLMFFSQGLVKRINSDVVSMLKPGSPLILESRKFCFNLSKESSQEFEKTVMEIIKEVNFEKIGLCDFRTQSILKYKAKLVDNMSE